jgi:hypothetical protein
VNPTAPSPDTDTFAEVPNSSASAIDDLQSIAPLILNIEMRKKVLAGFDGPRRLAAEVVLQCAARLTAMTEWPEEELLEALGCPIRTYGRFTGVELAALERCRLFMALVTRGAGLVDLVSDRRHVVTSSARLLKAIGGNVGDFERYLREEEDDLTAIDYIRLGEINAANEQVRRLAGRSGLGQIAADNDPFAGVGRVHLSTTRMQMLIEGRWDDLGAEVASHMKLHIDGSEGVPPCEGCKEAYDYLVSHPAPAAPSQ